MFSSEPFIWCVVSLTSHANVASLAGVSIPNEASTAFSSAWRVKRGCRWKSDRCFIILLLLWKMAVLLLLLVRWLLAWELLIWGSVLAWLMMILLTLMLLHYFPLVLSVSSISPPQFSVSVGSAFEVEIIALWKGTQWKDADPAIPCGP